MTYYNINGGWKSEDGRVTIMHHYEEVTYYKGSVRKYAKKKRKLYVVTVDGKELKFAEETFRDAKEMALKQLRHNNLKKKAEESNDQ